MFLTNITAYNPNCDNCQIIIYMDSLCENADLGSRKGVKNDHIFNNNCVNLENCAPYIQQIILICVDVLHSGVL